MAESFFVIDEHRFRLFPKYLIFV